MLHANLAYTLALPLESDKLDYLIKGNLDTRRFSVGRISTKAQEELTILGYKVVYDPKRDEYMVSW